MGCAACGVTAAELKLLNRKAIAMARLSVKGTELPSNLIWRAWKIPVSETKE